MTNEKNILCFHLHIIHKLKELNKFDNILKLNEVRKVILFSRIPKKMHSKFIREMEELGLIKIINKNKIELI